MEDLKPYSLYKKAYVPEPKRFKYMKYIFETIVEKSDYYMIFGGAARDLLRFHKNRNYHFSPTDIDVLLNPEKISCIEDAETEFKIFEDFVRNKFNAFEVKKTYVPDNLLCKSFAVPYYNGPSFASKTKVFTKIDIVYKKPSQPFKLDFNVNSLVYSKNGVTTLNSINRRDKDFYLEYKTDHIQLLGNLSTEIHRTIKNLRDKKCFGMYDIDTYRLQKMLRKGYTCYTLITHVKYHQKSIFLKYTPLPNDKATMESVLVCDEHEIDDEDARNYVVKQDINIFDISNIPFNTSRPQQPVSDSE